MISAQLRRAPAIGRFLRASQVNQCRLASQKSGNGGESGGIDPSHPFRRTLGILGKDMQKMRNWFASKKLAADVQRELEEADFKPRDITGPDEFQTHCDVLIIGGGGIGSSTAFWLKKAARDGLNVVVVEKDSTYKEASTTLSVGGVRQQFSLPENIQMSLFGADFIRNIKEYLGDEVEPNFCPYGYLVLASEAGAEQLMKNSALQNELGARNELLTAQRLKEKFPWLNTDGLALGCHGLEKEGWFDPWALLSGYRRRAREYGAHYVEGKVVGFDFEKNLDIFVEGVAQGEYESTNRAIIQMPDGEKRTINFAVCVLACGACSGEIAKLARIGTGPGLLSVPLPIEPRKRYVYVFNTQGQNAPGLNTPLTIDPTNTYFRRDGLGGNYIGGCSPDAENEPCCENLDVDHNWFDNVVWPALANRVPAFESAKVCGSWAGYYEYNTFDANGIIGPHPYYHNFYIAAGFSGHGIQQTPAIGRAISELIIDGQFRTIDLSRLCFDRIIVDEPMLEKNIV
ncbi:unnamed protein product [Hermetia illucens]|uniref:FAD dependent oxidoreductase domain-containing protein n=1 Tax=Hermetia illucens TaxID=343691 RepID=A0A7R8URV8_HERIL|nr:FAD-dependent oxidoreductase domain-containing protein 1 [Hermetia illucens]CAD7085796.1 unnamed protein product [Hermetia illucens]